MNRSEALELGLDKFQPDKPCKRGHTALRWTKKNYCTQCSIEATKRSQEMNPEKVRENRERYYQKRRNDESLIRRDREKRMLKLYGVGYEWFLSNLLAQDYKCAICSSTIDSKTACVDHNHETGEARGLLCSKCNQALGLVGDSLVNLKEAIVYLTERGSYG